MGGYPSMRGMRLLSALYSLSLLVCLTARAAEPSVVAATAREPALCHPPPPTMQTYSAEPAGLGAGLVLDEHLLTDASRDQDYNGGGELTLSGKSSGVLGRTLDRALGVVDGKSCEMSGWDGLAAHSTHAFAAGLLVFTPRDLGARHIVRGDRPYASLFFLSAGRRYASTDSTVAYDTSLTV